MTRKPTVICYTVIERNQGEHKIRSVNISVDLSGVLNNNYYDNNIIILDSGYI